MKLRLHKMAIRYGLYSYHTSGCSLNVGRTWFGVWFLEGDYMPLTLNQCIHFQVDEMQNSLGDIFDHLAGDDTKYLIHSPMGDVVMLPYDGPYKSVIEEHEGEHFVKLPDRLVAKKGWNENTKLNMEVVDEAIHLTEEQ